MNIEALADKIIKAFPDLELNRNEILQKLKLLVYEFRVPEDEAVRTIKAWIAREHGKIKPEAPLVKIGELSEEYARVTIEAKAVKVWNPSNESTAAGMLRRPCFVSLAKRIEPTTSVIIKPFCSNLSKAL